MNDDTRNATEDELRLLYKELGWGRNHIKSLHDVISTSDDSILDDDEPKNQLSLFEE